MPGNKHVSMSPLMNSIRQQNFVWTHCRICEPGWKPSVLQVKGLRVWM
jgi:hypothetical protein